MNRQLLLALQKRNNERLVELRIKVENPETRAVDLEAIKTEIVDITAQLDEIATQLADDGEDGTDGTDSGSDGGEGRDGEPDGEGDKGGSEGEGDSGERGAGITPEQRTAITTSIKNALSTRNAKSTKKREQEVRSAFANFVVGKIDEAEARALGVVTGNGSVTIPEVIASEIITYAQEENLLRKYGTTHRTNGNVKYPVLVQKATANGTKTERTVDIPETTIEFDEILLDPSEFDALATVTKKLIKMSGVNVEEIVVEELKKAYVRKEIQFMFSGDEVGNVNPGALSKKAVAYYESAAVNLEAAGLANTLYKELVKMKGQLKTEVRKKSMWIVNSAAITALEGLLDANGRPLLYETPDGLGYKLLSHKLDFTDAADGTDATKPVFYFGDFKAFHIQDVIGAMELQKLIEKFSGTNKIGFQIYNLLDGQLVYSPFEPAVYRYEVGATAI